METSWLEDFLAVLDEGGFSRAAERRACSQPAFSRRIRALEDWVGASLFDRSTHSVRLTQAGERFQPGAEEMLRLLRATRQEAQIAAEAASETVRFAATHVLSLTFFPAWLRELEAAAPHSASFELVADNMVACERLMIEGKAHFLICHHHPAAATPLDAGGFRSVDLGEDALAPVAHPALQEATGGAETPGQAPFLAYAPSSGMGRILAANEAAKPWISRTEPVFTSHLATVLTTMARQGRGVAWAPLSLVREDLAAGRLCRVGGSAEEIPMRVRLVRPRARQSRAAETFWELAKSRAV